MYIFWRLFILYGYCFMLIKNPILLLTITLKKFFQNQDTAKKIFLMMIHLVIIPSN